MEIKAITGGLNVPEETILGHVHASIRRQLPQFRQFQPNGQRVAIVAGGPSLLSTIDELREAVFEGAAIVTVNGAYQWCIDHNFKPSSAILLDARPVNAKMLATPVPGCHYFLASQCAPETFDMVAARDVTLFHALSYEDAERPMLDAYYRGPKRYQPIVGGSTVMIRALTLLRFLGFLRMDVFGFDSCWLGMIHHAYAQVQNDGDQRLNVTVKIDGQADRVFVCAPWHLRQWEDFQAWVKTLGAEAELRVHGDGLITHMMRGGARLYREEEHAARSGTTEDAGVSDGSDSPSPADAGALVAQD